MKSAGSSYDKRRFGGVEVRVWTHSGRVTATGNPAHTTATDRRDAESWVRQALDVFDFPYDEGAVRRALWRGTVPWR